MGEEYKISEDKDEFEAKIEELMKDYEHMKERERQHKLAKHQMASLDIVTGVLIQARGILAEDPEMADVFAKRVEDLLMSSNALVRSFNKTFKDKSKKKGENA